MRVDSRTKLLNSQYVHRETVITYSVFICLLYCLSNNTLFWDRSIAYVDIGLHLSWEMPLTKSPLNLHQICIENISKNISYWCKDIETQLSANGVSYQFIIGPFEYLPSHCIKEILNKLGNRVSKVWLQTLVVSQLDEVDFTGCPKAATNDVLQFVINRCKKVSTLNISYCYKISTDGILQFLQTFGKSLVKLSLNGLKSVNDNVLKCIGTNCCKLRVLELNGLNNITEQGIIDLLFDRSCGINHDRSHKLRAIAYSLEKISFFEVTRKFDSKLARWFVTECKNLKIFESFSFWDVLTDILISTNNPATLRLQSTHNCPPLDMNCFDECCNISDENPLCIRKLFALIPQLRNLGIACANPANISHFYTAFTNDVSNPINWKSLTSLTIEWGFNLQSIILLGPKLPNLFELSITLSVYSNINFTLDSQVIPTTMIWPHLCKFELKEHFESAVGLELSTVVKAILLGHSLRFISLHLHNVDINSIINWLLCEQIVNNLHTAELCSKNLKLETFWNFLLENNCLKKLKVLSNNSLTLSHLRKAKSYITTNNIDLSLQYQ